LLFILRDDAVMRDDIADLCLLIPILLKLLKVRRGSGGKPGSAHGGPAAMGGRVLQGRFNYYNVVFKVIAVPHRCPALGALAYPSTGSVGRFNYCIKLFKPYGDSVRCRARVLSLKELLFRSCYVTKLVTAVYAW